MAPEAPLVELRHIRKSYPAVVANRDVSLAVAAGHVHALVGENGAGKSTLMRIVYGEEQPDGGDLLLRGVPTKFRSPRDAIAAGIGMVHQHFMLAEHLTVLENVVLGAEPSRRGLLDRRAARRELGRLSSRYGLDVDPDVTVADLGVGQRQRVEILKVLYRGAQVLIFDEPTAVLVPHEVRVLFQSLRGLCSEGLAVVFISHKLDEVLAVADQVTVIRAGTTVGTLRASDATAEQLAELMIGGELPNPPARIRPRRGDVALEVANLDVPDGSSLAVRGADLEVRSGEIVGLAGVEGNGQSELFDAILGLRPAARGTVRVGKQDVTRLNPRDRRRAGLACVPEDRHRQALLLGAALWENVLLGHERIRATTLWRVDQRAARRLTTELIERFAIVAPSPGATAATLSGGNQQKLVMARELAQQPLVLLAAHPSRGVDIGAQATIWGLLREARDAGLAVLLATADLEEMVELSDRIQVMLRGNLSQPIETTELTPSRLGELMVGATQADSGEAE